MKKTALGLAILFSLGLAAVKEPAGEIFAGGLTGDIFRWYPAAGPVAQ